MEIRASMTDVRKHFSELIAKVEFGGERFVIERFGVPVAGLVSMDDLARIQGLEAAEVAHVLSPRTGVRRFLEGVGRLWQQVRRRDGGGA